LKSISVAINATGIASLQTRSPLKGVLSTYEDIDVQTDSIYDDRSEHNTSLRTTNITKADISVSPIQTDRRVDRSNTHTHEDVNHTATAHVHTTSDKTQKNDVDKIDRHASTSDGQTYTEYNTTVKKLQSSSGCESFADMFETPTTENHTHTHEQIHTQISTQTHDHAHTQGHTHGHAHSTHHGKSSKLADPKHRKRAVSPMQRTSSR
jgi:hypothetical protein